MNVSNRYKYINLCSDILIMKKDTIKINVLKYIKKKKRITTYQIAKGCDIAWSTANIKCLRLQSEGIIASTEELVGMNKTVFWGVCR